MGAAQLDPVILIAIKLDEKKATTTTTFQHTPIAIDCVNSFRKYLLQFNDAIIFLALSEHTLSHR